MALSYRSKDLVVKVFVYKRVHMGDKFVASVPLEMFFEAEASGTFAG
jgi:hypothetical protein